MPGTLNDAGSPYSSRWGFIYLFNLIVGTGALTMPHAFEMAGWLISLVAVILLAIMSYATVTYVIETMASANAVLTLKQRNTAEADSTSLPSSDSSGVADTTQEPDESRPLLQHAGIDHRPLGGQHQTLDQSGQLLSPADFDIRKRVEMGQMTALFVPKVGIIFFYISIVLYLYGDLAIYVVTVTKSIVNVACVYKPPGMNSSNIMCTDNVNSSLPCWTENSLTRSSVYRIFLAVFALVICPWVYFNLQKTKYLQIVTTVMRWLAFAMMIILALHRLATHQGEGHPRVGKLSGLPSLFGVCVYSFMCHHSLPSIVTPVKDKRNIHTVFALDYLLILIFYVLLSFSGIFAFATLRDIYTLNFLCDSSGHPITTNKFVMYFLALFPVLTLSTNFPIIGISLRNNLKTLMATVTGKEHFPFALDRIVVPTVVIVIPLAIAMITDNVTTLVSVTGSFAGSSIQYFIPIILVFFSRRKISRILLEAGHDNVENPHTSPFKSIAWLIIVFIWALMCMVFIIVDRIQDLFFHKS